MAALPLFLFTAAVPAAGAELVDTLISSLGVTQDQAAGGAGAIFSLAKEKLTGEDFAKVTEAIPDVNALMEKAPKSSGMAGSIGQAASMLGDNAGSLEGIAGLGEAFSSLGLNADMAAKFIPVVLDFAQTKGGDTVMNLLQGVLK